MTWEIVFILSMILVCATVVYVVRVLTEEPKPEVTKSQVDSIADSLSSLMDEVDRLKKDQAEFSKVSDEMKKFMTQNNLANVFTPRSSRRGS
jgi:hypothetical protein